jgi:hypothetical protein
MARVAACPQCSHEILILDDDQEAWAKCPECRAFFQIRDASGREIQAALRVDEQLADRSSETVVLDDTMLDTFLSEGEVTHSGASDATVSEHGREVANDKADDLEISQDQQLGNEPVGVSATELSEILAAQPGEATVSNQSEATLAGPDSLLPQDIVPPAEDDAVASSTPEIDSPPAPTPAERLEHAEDRIDKWFRKTKAQLDTRLTAAGDDSELEEELESEPETGRPTWDDSDDMDRILADPDPAGVSNSPDELQSRHEDEAAADDEQPEYVTAARQSAEEPPQFFIPPGRLPRRKRSLPRTLAAAVLSGVVGLTLGYIVLLWLLGPTGDIFNLARYLPAAVLPGDFQTDLMPLPRKSDEVPRPDESLAGTNRTSQESDPAEQQASYTTTTQAEDYENGTGSEPSGDVAQPGTDEPQPIFDLPAAAPLAGVDQVPAGHLVNPPSFNADELAVSLRAAQDAQPKLVDGNLDDGREVQRAKGFSYSVLCDLAQKLSFVDATTRVEYAKALEADAVRLFRQTLADAHTRSEIARILPKWLASPHRQHGGVFFAGIISQQSEQGTVIECQVSESASETVVVLVPLAHAEQVANSSAPVGIVGWIVDSPAEKVSGYTGTAPQAIWAGRLLALE